MSGLSALKLVTGKPQQTNSPQHARRQKLCSKLDEQIQLAKAQQAGTEFLSFKTRTVKDEATGDSRRVSVPKKLKPWWWADDKGKFCITVRYGAKTLEIVEGKNAIETENMAEVISTLELLRSAVDSGDLDKRIAAVSGLVKAGFETDAAQSKKSTLKLPSKSI